MTVKLCSEAFVTHIVVYSGIWLSKQRKLAYITEVSSVNPGLGDLWTFSCDGVVMLEILTFLFVETLSN